MADGNAGERGRALIAALDVTEVRPSHDVPPAEALLPLDEWRTRLADARRDSVGTPGIHLDRSPTGAGKSSADVAGLLVAERGLVVVPTHENCTELVHDMEERGLIATAYPARTTEGPSANCWNEEANEAERMGLSFRTAVCPRCKQRERCQREGYLSLLYATDRYDVVVATHARAMWTRLTELSRGRSFWSLHEDAVDLLRPTSEIPWSDLDVARGVLHRMLNSPGWLNWFGRGKTPHVQESREAQFMFLRHLANVTDVVCETTLDRTASVEPCIRFDVPYELPQALLRATRESRSRFSGPAWRILLAHASRQLESLTAVVDQYRVAGGGIEPRHSLLAVWRNAVEDEATVWFCDATADPDRIASLTGREVHDRTPQGRLQARHRVVQVPRDVTRNTSESVVRGLLRGLLADHPWAKRVGVVTHRKHIDIVESIEPPFSGRVVRTTYFGSGDDRASNAWHRECNLLVVLGTPRIPPGAIVRHLIQVGEIEAANEDGAWEPIAWTGHTPDGRERVVKALGYAHPAWSRAHREIVRANLIQAVGRGRGILAEGIDVVLFSTEECGLPLAESEGPEPIGDKDMAILESLSRISPKRYLLREMRDNPSVGTREVARAVGLSESQARRRLSMLERRGLIRRLGSRKGWLSV